MSQNYEEKATEKEIMALAESILLELNNKCQDIPTAVTVLIKVVHDAAVLTHPKDIEYQLRFVGYIAGMVSKIILKGTDNGVESSGGTPVSGQTNEG